MGGAQLDLAEEIAPQVESAAGAEAAPLSLRLEVAERLAAHRRRRGQAMEAAAAASTEAPRSPKHSAAARVAERYAQTPSYRAFLAEQARLAIQAAAAAAEVAMRNAEAVAAVQGELLGELEMWNAPQEFSAATALILPAPAPAIAPNAFKPQASAAAPERPAGLTVRLYEDLREVPPPAPRITAAALLPGAGVAAPDHAETVALDAEIAFRQAPVFENYWEDRWLEEDPPTELPANLLAFPRQLVAARKARPQLAEGPLLEEANRRTAQLRIFEVEPSQIGVMPGTQPGGEPALQPAAAPEWTSTIRLPAHTAVQADPPPASMPLMNGLPALHPAPLELRSMAAVVDAALAAGGALLFVAAYAHAGGEIPGGLPALGLLAAVLLVSHVLYQLLFFSLGDQTPGMRYAELGLCTFADENPSRAAMRRRIVAQLVAIAPLGLGLLWIAVDDDGLGWHDRMSRMYQRRG